MGDNTLNRVVSAFSAGAKSTLQQSVERNEQFNKELTKESVSETTPNESHKKMQAIKLVLKNNGMDSQQQEKAFDEIKKILEE